MVDFQSIQDVVGWAVVAPSRSNLSRLFNNYNNYVINNGGRGLISETVTTNSSKALLVLLLVRCNLGWGEIEFTTGSVIGEQVKPDKRRG